MTRVTRLADESSTRPDSRVRMADRPTGCARRLLIVANVGLLLNVALSLASFLPVDLPWINSLDVRFFSGIGIAFFLDMSFWLTGWPGSALGVFLMAVAMVFGGLVAPALGLVGLALSLLMGTMVVLLFVSDLLVAADHARGSILRRPATWIGLVGDLTVAILVWVLWVHF